jgi:glucosamine-6-phosphate deaminase
MNLHRFPTPQAMGQAAAAAGANIITTTLKEWGHASIILATGASQFTMYEALLVHTEIDWSRVTIFHLDEYISLPFSHPASFRLYLWQRFISKLPVSPAAVHWIAGDADPREERIRLNHLIQQDSIDVAFVGIGENGHLAFNDPPADFETDEPYLNVTLDEACRRQQLGEGWFPTLADVPTHAISMSIRQIMKSQHIICTVPDARKATAVKNSVEGPVTNLVPASILQQHSSVKLFLDDAAASSLTTC